MYNQEIFYATFPVSISVGHYFTVVMVAVVAVEEVAIIVILLAGTP